MTLTAETTKLLFDGDGATTGFAVTFKFLGETHLRVVLCDADLNLTEQVLDTDYSVTHNPSTLLGTVTMLVTAPAVGEVLVVSRNAPLTQETDLPELGLYSPAVLETALDKITMLLQQINEKAERALRLPISSDGTSPELPAGTPDYILRMNSDGTGFEWVEPGDVDTAIVGTNVQAWNAKLDALAALTPTANKLVYWTGASACALTSITSSARALLALSGTVGQYRLPYFNGVSAAASTEISEAMLSFLGYSIGAGAANKKIYVEDDASGFEVDTGFGYATKSFNAATASGTFAVTGVGFRSGLVICFMCCNFANQWSIGFGAPPQDAVTLFRVYNDTANSTDGIAFYDHTSGNYHDFEITALDDDGFTVTTTKTGSPTGTLTFHFFCFR